jgi:hypothetical protein
MATFVERLDVYKTALKSVTVNGSETFTASSSNATIGNSVKIGSSNPSWKIQVAKKLDASTNYAKTHYSVKNRKPAYVRSSYILPMSITRHWVKCFDYGVGISIGSYDDTDVRAIALDRLKRKLREATSEAQAMAPIAECRELGRTIRAAADFTARALEAAIEIKRRRCGRKAIRLLQDTWLNWNFGIAPLIRDIASIGNSIANYIVREDLVVKLYGKYSKTSFGRVSGSFSFADGVSPDGLTATGNIFYTKTISYKFVGAYNLRLKSANDYTLLDNLGINLRAVPSTLWELTALSWIADYFGTIGNYLSDVFYSPPGNLIYLNEIRVCEGRQFSDFAYKLRPGFSPSVYVIEESLPGNCEFTIFDFQRTALSSLPVSPLRVKTFDEIAPHSVSKVLNLLSLLGRN